MLDVRMADLDGLLDFWAVEKGDTEAEAVAVAVEKGEVDAAGVFEIDVADVTLGVALLATDVNEDRDAVGEVLYDGDADADAPTVTLGVTLLEAEAGDERVALVDLDAVRLAGGTDCTGDGDTKWLLK
jgi:hypothetical protein